MKTIATILAAACLAGCATEGIPVQCAPRKPPLAAMTPTEPLPNLSGASQAELEAWIAKVAPLYGMCKVDKAQLTDWIMRADQH